MIKLKDIIKEAKWSDRKWGDPLPTLEDYIVEFTKNLKPSDGSKEVTFTNKDNYDKAVKSGDYEKPDDSGGGEKEEPSGKLGTGDFERETEPERGEKPKAKRSDRYKDVDTSWQDDPEAAAAQGQQGMQPGQAEPKGDADIDYVDPDDIDDLPEPEDEEPKAKRSDRYKDVDTSWMDDPDAVAAQGSPGYTTDDNWGREKGYGQAGHKSYDSSDIRKRRKAKKDGKKESITINGKQYKRISESVEPTIFDPLTEAKKQLGGLYYRMIGK